jgi:hypothetical protein
MKFVIVSVLLIIFGFFAFATYESDAQDRAWENFIVDHHCRVVPSPRRFWQAGPTLWSCDGANLYHN